MALATNSTTGEIHLNGDFHGSADPHSPELTPTGVQAGTYNLPNIVVDSKGRVLYAEDFSLDDVPLTSATVYGIGKIGSGLVYDAGQSEVDATIATTSTKGIVQVGTGLEVTAGVLSLDWTIDIATDSTIGGVIVPTSGNIDIDGSGNISIPAATNSSVGLIQVLGGDGLDVTSGDVTFDYSAAGIATTTTLGAVQVPVNGNIDVDGSGNISVPTASGGVLGVVTIESGDPYLSIDGAGEITSTYTAPTPSAATTTTAGNVIVPTSGHIDVDGSGNISIPNATPSSKGVVQTGSNISSSSGVISVPTATNSVFGLAKSADVNNIVITTGDVDVHSSVIKNNESNIWTKSNQFESITISGTTSLTPAAGNQDFKKTLTNNAVLNLPSSPINNTWYNFLIDLNGYTLTLNAGYLTPTASTSTPSGKTLISAFYYNSTFYTIIQPDFV